MKKLIINTRGGTEFLMSSEVVYLKAEGAYCLVRTLGGREIKVSKNMNSMMNLLMPSADFLKVHRSWVVNKNFIIGIFKSKLKNTKRYIQLAGDYRVPLPLAAYKWTIGNIKSTMDINLIQETIQVLSQLTVTQQNYIIEQVLYPQSPQTASEEKKVPIRGDSNSGHLQFLLK